MPNDDNIASAALIALGAVGVIGLGVVGAAAFAAQQRRSNFHESLRSGLSERGVELVNAELGRPEGELVWFVTVKLSSGVVTYQAPYESGTDVYAPETANNLVHRLVEAIRRDHPRSAFG